jgi:hypothetical protein
MKSAVANQPPCFAAAVFLKGGRPNMFIAARAASQQIGLPIRCKTSARLWQE